MTGGVVGESAGAGKSCGLCGSNQEDWGRGYLREVAVWCLER